MCGLCVCQPDAKHLRRHRIHNLEPEDFCTDRTLKSPDTTSLDVKSMKVKCAVAVGPLGQGPGPYRAVNCCDTDLKLVRTN